jgi:hypothetical protein
MSEELPARMRCPTCRAEQEWSDACRRCQSDLSLFRQTVTATLALRHRVLTELQAGRFPEAQRLAQELVLMNDETANRRLMAVCSLLAEDFDQAARVGRSLNQE